MPASFPGRLVTALVVVAAAPLAVASDATAIDWSAATPVSAGTAAAVQAVAVAPDGAATVFYAVETGVHTRLMASHRPASGAGWTATQVSSDQVADDNFVGAVASSDGSVTVAWVDADTNVAKAATRAPGSAGFGTPQQLGPTDKHLDIDQNASGDVVVSATAPGLTSVWAAHRRAGASWSTPATVLAGGSSGLGWPTLAADHSGAFHLAVARNSPSGVVAIRLGPGATDWDPASTVYAGAVESEGNPVDLVVEPDDTVTSVWQREVAPGKGFDPLLSASRGPGAAVWGAPVDPTGTGATGAFPKLLPLAGGGAEVYWTNPGFGLGSGVRASGSWSGTTLPAIQGYAMVAYPHPLLNAEGGSTAIAIAAAGMGPPIDLIARTGGQTRVLASNVAMTGAPPPAAGNRFGAITTAWLSATDQRVYVSETPGDYTQGDPPSTPEQPGPETDLKNQVSEDRPPAGSVPPKVLAPLPEAVLAGRTIRIDARLTLRRGRRCGGVAIARIKVAKRTHRGKLKVRRKAGVCRATGVIRLRKAPPKKVKLRVTITAAPAKSRTLRVVVR